MIVSLIIGFITLMLCVQCLAFKPVNCFQVNVTTYNGLKAYVSSRNCGLCDNNMTSFARRLSVAPGGVICHQYEKLQEQGEVVDVDEQPGGISVASPTQTSSARTHIPSLERTPSLEHEDPDRDVEVVLHALGKK